MLTIMTRRRKIALVCAALLGLVLVLRVMGIGDDARTLAYTVRNCDRMVIKPAPYSIANIQSTLELSGVETVRDFASIITFDKIDQMPCKCEGDVVFEFFDREKQIATVSYHHSSHLRWWRGSWKGDAYLTDEAKRTLPIWLKDHGFTESDKLVPLKR